MERTGGPAPEMRLGSVQDAGTLTLHCHVFCPWGGVPGEGDGKVGVGGQRWVLSHLFKSPRTLPAKSLLTHTETASPGLPHPVWGGITPCVLTTILSSFQGAHCTSPPPTFTPFVHGSLHKVIIAH